ncbi:probable protein phosphatase 2C 35 [Macadamia integrifolia]|uniref:probable protein phosphatase 2C 35 n=1 Tax=Macadamia integrifolia TaxID=60698 RepID=UPI001C531AB1|nr:probable protein phosphatase 2C 35 [Macadamia integrifolia]
MGCVQGKCCGRHSSSSDRDIGDFPESGPRSSNGVHVLGNYRHILTERSLEVAPVPSHNFHLEYSALTQRGYYPDHPDKENQDSFCIKTQVQGNPNLHFFGVYDGHGHFGTQCSYFVRDRLIEILSKDSALSEDPIKAFNSALLATNSELHMSEIDDSMSGTTAISVLVCGNTLFIANVGDSRAVIAVKSGNRVVAEDLSRDHTPFREDECERVKLCGARVLNVSQLEGDMDPEIQSWGDEESSGSDPPRVWLPNGMYPGTAFTRSLGDSTAEEIGVIAVPEVSVVQLTPNHLFFVIASDGVFEFLSSQAVVNMALRYTDPRDACAAIAGESYRLWLEHDTRTDDITIIIVHIKGLSNSGSGTTDETCGVNMKSTPLMTNLSGGSEMYRSVRSNFSEYNSCQLNFQTERSVVPSSTHSR